MEIEKMKLKSMDVGAENRAQLKQLFPSVFTETVNDKGELVEAVDFEKLKAEIGTFSDLFEARRERYGMDWPGKKDCMKLIQQPTVATLKPCREESVNFDTTENLFIEGDNLEVLKLLQKSYYGKVKMIYIDPPYNTGKEFIYPDNYKENLETYLQYSGQTDSEGRKFSTNTANEGRFHTKWMNMMYPRLYLARNLLEERGIICVSIDENEVRNLRSLCDEIYGEDNFIASAVWQKRTSPDARLAISSGHEYILIYAKNIDEAKGSINKLPLTQEQKKTYKNPDNDPRGPWVSSDFTAQIGHATPQQFYTITAPNGTEHVPPAGTCWKNIEPVFLQKLSEGRFWFGKDGNAFPRRKTYLAETEGRTVWTWWSNKDVGHTQEATKELKGLLNAPNVFDNPKPTKLIKRMLHLFTEKDSLVLDFFAGSSTVAHAIIDYNNEYVAKNRFVIY